MAMGPFRMGDLAGNDIGWAIRKRRYLEKPDMKYSKTADLLCEKGRFGQKVGKGWYDYVPGKARRHPERRSGEDDRPPQGLGITPRKISDEEIVQRLVFALVNEGRPHPGRRGIANKASDIDMVYIYGYGFPVHRGGPMNYADTVGLFNVVQAMKRFAQNPLDDAAFWKNPPAAAKAGWPPMARPSICRSHPPNIFGGKDMTRRNRFHRPHPLTKGWKGAFNMTHGATLGGHVVQHAIQRAGIEPPRWTTSSWAAPGGCHRRQHRPPDRAARRLPVTRVGHDHQPLLLVGLQTIATGRAAHHRQRRRCVRGRRRRKSSPACRK